MKGNQRINHGGHGDQGEKAGRDTADAVAKVQETDGEAAQDDSEVEPWEEGSFVGEEDFRLNASGERNTLAWLFDISRWYEGLKLFFKIYRVRSGGEAAMTSCM